MALWKAQQGTVKVDLASNVTITTAAALDTFFGGTATTLSAYMKDITIVIPEGDIEQLNLMGFDSAGLQNSELDQKAYGLAEISGTMILGHDELLLGDVGSTNEHLFFGTGTDIPSAGTTHTRYQAGKLLASGLPARPESAWLLNLDDGTDEVNIVLDNAFVTKFGDVVLSDGDSHFEVAVTVKARANDFYMEFKN